MKILKFTLVLIMLLFQPVISSGECIQGDCKNGQGTLTDTDYGTTYVGQFKDFNYNGQGTLTGTDGVAYTGQFKDGFYDGQGNLTDYDGVTYVGQFEDGYISQGTITDSYGVTTNVGKEKPKD